MKKKLLFIINPISGIGKQKKIESLLEKKLDLSLFDYEIAYTERVHHGTKIAEQAIESGEYDAIVAVGGDGSVNDVVTGFATFQNAEQTDNQTNDTRHNTLWQRQRFGAQP